MALREVIQQNGEKGQPPTVIEDRELLPDEFDYFPGADVTVSGFKAEGPYFRALTHDRLQLATDAGARLNVVFDREEVNNAGIHIQDQAGREVNVYWYVPPHL